MMVMTAKVSKTKLIAIACMLVIVLGVVLALLAQNKNSAAPDAAQAEAVGVSTNEQRIAYLATYGWQVDPTPVETQEVKIPEVMDEVFEKYNELQRSQGFDLTKFSGKQAKRYVYQVTNYEGATAPVYATLLICQDAVIGGDITSTAGSGLMHGLAKP